MENTNFLGATLRLKYSAGQNEKGEMIFTTKTYRNLNNAHTSTDLLAVATALASLSSRPLASTMKQETTDLS